MRLLGAIKGLVKDADDSPIEDVSIVLVTGPTHRDIAALTGIDGTFGFNRLRPGNYVIKAYGSDVESDEIPVRVLAKKITFVEIWLEIDIINEEGDFIDEKDNVVDEI